MERKPRQRLVPRGPDEQSAARSSVTKGRFVPQRTNEWRILQVTALDNANFNGVELLGANFDWARGNNVNFSKARMTGSTFRQARLLAANFNDAGLQELACSTPGCLRRISIMRICRAWTCPAQTCLPLRSKRHIFMTQRSTAPISRGPLSRAPRYETLRWIALFFFERLQEYRHRSNDRDSPN